MAASGVPVFPAPENPNDPGRGPLIIITTWVFTAISILTVAARFYVRITTRLLGADDWIMLAALGFQIGAQSCVTQAYLWGLGKHDRDLTYFPQLVNIQKWNYISVVPNLVASSVSRISAAVLLIRLFGTKRWFKWYLIIYTAIETILIVVVVPVLFTQSSPIEGLWNPFIPARRHSPTRSGNIVYLIQALLTFSDLTYVLFPIIIIYRLNMSIRRKLGLGVLMALSLITMAFSILKTIQVHLSVGRATSTNRDIQYNTSLIELWSGLEQCLVIILGSVPALRSLVKMDHPYIHSMTSALYKVVSSVKRSSRSLPRSDKHDKTEYHDLELQPSTEGLTHKNESNGNTFYG